MTLFIQAYRMAAEPYFFNESKNDDARKTYAQTMTAFVAVCCFIFLAIMLHIDVLKYFIDAKFHEGLFIVPILLLANMCLGIYYNLSIWYKLSNKTLSGAYIAIAGALLTILLNVWWIPLYGYAGSAWATLCCYAFMMIVSYIAGQRYYPVPYDTLKIALMIAGCILIYFLYNRYIQRVLLDYPALYFVFNALLLIIIAGFIYLFVFKKSDSQKLQPK
jgi:O-antigen/teichoic acid export membrane protein